MTNKLDKHDRGVSLGEQRRNRAYYKEFGPAMAAYVCAVFAGVWIGNDTPWKRVFFVAITFVPVLLGCIAMVRHVRRIDEFERLQVYRAMAISFGIAMVVSIFLALMTSAGIKLSAELLAWTPFIAGMITWGALACFRR
jgi:amino acid transporter